MAIETWVDDDSIGTVMRYIKNIYFDAIQPTSPSWREDERK